MGNEIFHKMARKIVYCVNDIVSCTCICCSSASIMNIMNDKYEVSCGNCKFWKPGTADAGQGRIGECRFSAPNVHKEAARLYGEWPLTVIDSWCGEFGVAFSEYERRGTQEAKY